MRLLLVEDDIKLASVLSAGLREEGYAVSAVGTGAAALDALLNESLDACILDVQLPDIEGFTVLHRTRAAQISTPVLILTARDEVDDRVRGLDEGADDYLVKPFAFAELLARLRVLLRRRNPPKAGTLRVGDLELDRGRHLVRRGADVIAVTPKQFSLLEYLLLHRGHVVPRNTLLSQVFGYDFDPGTNLVDVHIGQLRRRIDVTGLPSVIESVRGVGYRISDRDG